MRMENAQVWCVFMQKKTTVTLRASTKNEPTIDFCMKKLGQATLIDATLEKVEGGKLAPDPLFPRSIIV